MKKKKTKLDSMILNFESIAFNSATINVPNKFIDKCPRCLYKFEYKDPLVKRCYCGSCTADITEFYIRIFHNYISSEECTKLFDKILKYSKEEIEIIKNNIEAKDKKI